mgnify:CR=1 FL=1
MTPAAVLFDAYGTLFDVHSVTRLAESRFPGHGAALSAAWRGKQLEYTWLRSLMKRHRDFWDVTRDALDHAFGALGLPENEGLKARLMDAYLSRPSGGRARDWFEGVGLSRRLGMSVSGVG